MGNQNLGGWNRILLHILILFGVLVGSILFFEQRINQAAPDVAAVMENSTFPLVYMRRNGVNFNCLSGYAREMDVSRMRDCITPLTSDRRIGIQIETFSGSIDNVSYEVLTKDGKTSLENTQVIKLEKDNDVQTAELQLRNQMLMNQEYVLKLRLVSGGREIFYYTNVLLSDGLHTDEYLNFVSGFYDKTVNRTDLDAVGAAVEPDETTDVEATMAYMDIHDSVDQLTWKSLQPQIYYKPTPRIREINQHTASLSMEYRIAAVSETGATEVYNVDEFYRVRFTDSRVFLLNFERTTDEVFNPENDVLNEKGIRLGITGKNVEYASDDRGRVIAFVQENELWTYERSSGRLTSVFSFPQKENMDFRDFQDANDIRILKVFSTGDVWFVVDGYMNRGTHEGENGVALYFYDAATAMVDEKVFVASMENREIIERDVNTLAYVTNDAMLFYLWLEDKLWKIRLADRTFEAVAENVQERCCAGSASGRYFAWLAEGEEYNSSTLCWTDLETGTIWQIESENGERIRPVCYMNEDLVYGLATQSDLSRTSMEFGFFPMYCLKIMNGDGETIKNYEPTGYLVTGVEQSEHMLSLTRAARESSGNGLVAASTDEIVDTDTASSVAMGIATEETTRRQNIVYLRVGGSATEGGANLVRSKIIRYSVPRVVELPENDSRVPLYYVYASGGLFEVFSKPSEAVVCADARVGVVTDREGRYVWVRGDRPAAADISVEKVPEALKTNDTGEARVAAVPNVLPLDLTGCTLDEVLYFVAHGMPVAAKAEEGPVTIVGYDEYNTHLLDAGEDAWRYYGINDSTRMFEEQGNAFWTYLTDGA